MQAVPKAEIRRILQPISRDIEREAYRTECVYDLQCRASPVPMTVRPFARTSDEAVQSRCREETPQRFSRRADPARDSDGVVHATAASSARAHPPR
jgi:hypothetical protein